MSTEKKTVYILLAILLVAALITFWFSGRKTDNNQEALEELNQELLVDKFGYLTDLSGEKFTLKTDPPAVKVVTHFASWCPACLSDMQILKAVAADPFFSEISFFALNRMEPLNTVNSYLQEMNFENPTSLSILVDTKDAHYKSIGGFTMPETIIYGKKGETLNHWRGPLDEGTVKELLKSILNSN